LDWWEYVWWFNPDAKGVKAMRFRETGLEKAGRLAIVAALCGSLSMGLEQMVLVPDGDFLQFLGLPRGGISSRWDWGTLVGIGEPATNPPLLYAVNREGQMEQIALTIPDSGYTLVRGAAGGPDGAIVATGSAFSADGRRSGFLAWIAPDRKRQTVVRTWPFFGDVVTIAPDGIIWAIGWTEDEEDRRNTQFNVLQRFDSSGRLLSSSVVSARGRPGLGGRAFGLSELKATRDRVGWLTNGLEYIELSLGGHETQRFPPPPVSEPDLVSFSLALNEENEVLVGARDRATDKWQVWVLQRAARTWTPFEIRGAKHPKWGRLLGFDGGSLILTDEHRVVRRYRVDETKPGATGRGD
jgi:hypothetical protein